MTTLTNASYRRPDGTVRYGELTPAQIGEIGLDAGLAAMEWVERSDVSLKDPNLNLRAAMGQGGPTTDLREVGQTNYNAGARFAVNTGLVGGKLETVNEYDADSDETIYHYAVGDYDEDDPRGWPGGARDVGRVKLDGELVEENFGAACSGIEGYWDRFVSKTMTAAMAAAWVLDQLARHENAKREAAEAATCDGDE